MAYYTGSVTSFAELLTVLISNCEAHGWAWNGGAATLHKGAAFVQLVAAENMGLSALGKTSLAGGDAPNIVKIGYRISGANVDFPGTYHLHIVGDEVYLLLNFNVDRWQWLCFGLAGVEGLPGTGCFVAATMGGVSEPYNPSIYMGPDAGGGHHGSTGTLAPLPFYSTLAYGTSRWNIGPRNSFFNSGLVAGSEWALAYQNASGEPPGIRPLAPLLGLQPSQRNGESVLLPIRAWKQMPEKKIALCGELAAARFLRIDNLEPGDILTLGHEQWKVYPGYRKNTAQRNGGNGYVIDHSGTFGWCIRYEVGA